MRHVREPDAITVELWREGYNRYQMVYKGGSGVAMDGAGIS